MECKPTELTFYPFQVPKNLNVRVIHIINTLLNEIIHAYMHALHAFTSTFVFMILLRNLKPNMRNKNQMQCCDCRVTLRFLYIHIGRVSFLLICYRGCWHVEVVHTNLQCLRNVTKVLLVLIFHSININHSILEYFVLCDGSAAISLHHVLV